MLFCVKISTRTKTEIINIFYKRMDQNDLSSIILLRKSLKTLTDFLLFQISETFDILLKTVSKQTQTNVHNFINSWQRGSII